MESVEAKVEQGRLRGLVQPDGIAVFRGIPYAAAPEGALRFRAPAPAAGWDGVRDAAAFGAAPPQPAAAPGVPPAWQPADGLDCLRLNVWTPDASGAGLPVMVFLHGGAWRIGSAGLPQYDGSVLAAGGVVLVTLDYRVGFEGFGHLDGAPDNRGLLDQRAALEWLRRNVSAFGGDPDRITVLGQSAGAASAVYHLRSGLFRRAIAQSLPAGVVEPGRAAEVTRIIAEAAGVPPTLEAFETLAPGRIVAVQDTPLRTPADGPSAFGPVLDGDLVTGQPWAAVSGDADLVCGWTREEFRIFAPAAPPALVQDRTETLFARPARATAEAHARTGARTWLYEFAWSAGPLGAAHTVDLPFVFGHPGTRFAAARIGTPPPPDFDDLSTRLRTAWTAFAATGDPGWPAYPEVHVWS